MARSVADLDAAALLLHCYGPQPGEMATGQRRAMLQGQYHFTCDCAACRNPPKAEAAMQGLRCGRPGCMGVASVPCDADAGIASKYELVASAAACDGCGAILSEKEWRGELEPQLARAQQLFDEGCQSLYQWHQNGTGADLAAATAALQESLTLRQAILHPNNQVLGSTHDVLAAALEATGNDSAAAHELLASLTVAELNFPEGSTNVAMQQLKVAAALRRRSESDSDRLTADSLAHSALQVLQLHFGEAAAAQAVL